MGKKFGGLGGKNLKHFLKYLQLKVLEHLELALISLFMNDNSVTILMEFKLKGSDALKTVYY